MLFTARKFLPPSCAPAWRWRQGQALRVLRNLDTAGRGRSIDRAGSGGMPLSCPTKGIALEPFLRWPGPTIRTTLVQSVLSLRACLDKIGGHHRAKAHD